MVRSMDPILLHALKIARLIRDSEEGQAWREAWADVAKVPREVESAFTPFNLPIPFIEAIHHLRVSDQGQTRPLLFPLLLSRAMPNLSQRKPHDELRNYPRNLTAYVQLTRCMVFTVQLAGLLRRVASIHSRPLLIYALPGTPWGQYDSPWELPWGLGEKVAIPGRLDARHIGLDQTLPSIAVQLGQELNKLIVTIKECSEWKSLHRWHRQLRHDRQLVASLEQAQARFRQAMTEAMGAAIPRPVWRRQVGGIAEEIYSTCSPDAKAYATSFLEYEWLVERVYWLVSHLTFYESFSGLTSSNSMHLQQVSLSAGRQAALTSLLSPIGPAVDVGRIVHIELPESGHVFDGLYQIELRSITYQPRGGVRDYLRARCLWHCTLDEITKRMRQESSSLIKSAAVPEHSEMKLTIDGPDGSETSWDIRETLRLNILKTMYF